VDYGLSYSIICLLSAILAFALGLLATSRVRSLPTAWPFATWAFASSVYAFSRAFESMCSDFRFVRTWFAIEFLGLAFLPLAFLWLALTFTETLPRVKRWFFPLSLGISLFIVGAVFSNDWHRLFYSSLSVEMQGGFPVHSIERGPLSLSATGWSVSALLGALFLYGLHALRVSLFFRRRARIMFSVALSTIFAVILYRFDFSLGRSTLAPSSLPFLPSSSPQKLSKSVSSTSLRSPASKFSSISKTGLSSPICEIPWSTSILPRSPLFLGSLVALSGNTSTLSSPVYITTGKTKTTEANPFRSLKKEDLSFTKFHRFQSPEKEAKGSV